jgi:hypothetical protein
MKRYLLPLPALVSLLVAAPAPAKQVSNLEVCGSSGCQETKKVVGFHPGGSDAQPPKSAAAFYRVTMTIRAQDHRERFTIAYLPGAGLTRAKAPDGSESWATVDAKTKALYDRLAKGIAPFPASRLGKIDPAPAARVHSVVPAPVTPSDDGGFPWLVALLAGTGAACLGVLAALRRRLRTRQTASSPAATPAS